MQVDQIKKAAEASFGKRFAGIGIDRTVTPNLLRVYVVAATDSDRAELAKPADDNPQVTLEEADATWDELFAAKVAVSEELSARGVKPPYTVGADLATQAVIVETDDVPTADRSEIDAAAGGIDVHYRAFPDTVQLAHTCRSCYPPYEAGEDMGGCTAGFAMKNANATNFFATSAGHCHATGTHVYIGNNDLGAVQQSTYFDQETFQADALRIAISEANARPPNIFGHRLVVAKYTNPDLDIGTRLCFQGASSGGNNCGNIDEVDREWHYSSGKVLTHYWCFDPCRGRAR